jgi:hypothetical protein
VAWVRALYYLLGAGASFVLLAQPEFVFLSLLLAAASVLLLALDLFGRNPLFTLFNRGFSQNVIARHIPPGSYDRRRKIIVIAHYDAGRSLVQAAPFFASHYVTARRIVRYVLVTLLVVVAVIMLPLPEIMGQVLDIVAVALGVVALCAAFVEIANMFTPFSKGVNSNASGVAAMMGVAEALTMGGVLSAEPGLESGERQAGPHPNTQRHSETSRNVLQKEPIKLRRGGAGKVIERSRSQTDEPGLETQGQASVDAARPVGGMLGEPGEPKKLRRGGAGAVYERGRVGADRGRSSGDSRVGARGFEGEESGARRSAGSFDGRGAAGGTVGTNIRTGVGAAAAAAAAAAGGGPGAGVTSAGAGAGATGGVTALAGMTGKPGSGTVVAAGTGPAAATGTSSVSEQAPVISQGDLRARMADGTGDSAAVSDSPYPSSERVLEANGDRPDVSGRVSRPQEHQVNPSIRTRPNLKDQEELSQKVAIEAQRQRREQEQDQAQAQTSAMPAWYENAKKKAADKKPPSSENVKPTGSKFGNIPIADEARKPAAAEWAARKSGPGIPGMTARDEAETQEAARDEAEAQEAPSNSGAAAKTAAVAAAAAAAQEEANTAPGAPDSSAATAGFPANAQGARPSPRASARQGTQPAPSGARPSPGAGKEQKTPIDLSGIDRSAFSVMASDDTQGAVIVPENEPAASAPEQHSSQRVLVPNLPAPVPESRRRSLNIPSLTPGDTGSIPQQQAAFDEGYIAHEQYLQPNDSLVSRTGSFAALGATGTMKPVGEELLQYHGREDIYIDDADDSHAVDAQAPAGTFGPAPQEVDIPESRARSFLGNIGDRLSGKRRREGFEDSASNWLGVEDDFNARREGSSIGTWDNFADEEDDGWKGGSYGGATHEENVGAMAAFSTELLNKEVWLVAVGAHEVKNAGIKALLHEYAPDLRNALIINLDSVGAGDLCFTVSEGTFRKVNTDSRLQNLIRSSARSIDVDIKAVPFAGYTTDATEVLHQGSRAISIMGLGKHLPKDWRWSDNNIDALDEWSMVAACDLVLETIKSS